MSEMMPRYSPPVTPPVDAASGCRRPSLDATPPRLPAPVGSVGCGASGSHSALQSTIADMHAAATDAVAKARYAEHHSRESLGAAETEIRNLQAQVAAEKRARETAMEAAGRWRTRALQAESREALLQEGIIARSTFYNVRFAFEEWQNTVKMDMGCRARMRRAVVRMQHTAVAGSFGQWSDHVQRLRRMRYLVRRWRLHFVSRVCKSWKQLTHEGIHQKLVLVNSLCRKQRERLESAFDAWYQFTRLTMQESIEHTREVAQASMHENEVRTSQILRGELKQSAEAIAGLLTHTEFTTDMCSRWESKAISLHATCQNLQQSLGDVTKQLQHSDVIFLQYEQKQIMQQSTFAVQQARAAERILQRWKMQGVTKCFSSWLDAVAMKRKLRTMLGRLEMIGVSSAFDGWQASVDALKSQRALVGRVLQRMQRVALSSAVCGWSAHTKHSVRSRSIVQRLLCRWVWQCVAKAFSGWHSWVDEKVSRQRIVAKVLSRLEQGGLASAFDGWHESVKVAATQRAVVGRVLLRMQRRATASAFGRWAEFRSDLMRARRLLSRLQSMRLSQCWSSWVGSLEMRKSCAALELARMDVIASQIRHRIWCNCRAARLLTIVLRQCVGTVFQRWTAFAGLCRRKKLLLSRALSRCRNCQVSRLVSVIVCWSDVARLLKQERACIDSSTINQYRKRQLSRNVLSRSFGRWKEIPIISLRTRWKLNNGQRFATEQKMAAAFRAWWSVLCRVAVASESAVRESSVLQAYALIDQLQEQLLEQTKAAEKASQREQMWKQTALTVRAAAETALGANVHIAA